MKSIAIADSHILCREALCDFIRHAEKSYEIQGFSDFSSLTHHVQMKAPDLVLIEEGLSGFDGNIIKSCTVALIVPWLEEKHLSDVSYHGVFPKTLSSKNILSGIQEILAGRTFFPSSSQIPLSRMHEKALYKPAYDFGLTAREKEVLEYLVKGQANKEIARALNLQVVTVKLHVRGICRKLKAANRTQAALIAKGNGWG